MKDSQRKVILINPKFQLRVMAWMLGISAFVISVFYGAIWYFFRNLAAQGLALGFSADHPFFEFLRDRRLEMNIIFIATAVIVFIVVCLLGLIMSHRIAGPLYRMHRHLIAVSNGETTADVQFRVNDYFSEVADAYNQQMELFRKHSKTK